MKRRLLGNPLWLSLVMTAALAWLQIQVAENIDTIAHRQLAIYASAAVMLVFFGLIALYTVFGRRGGLLFWGESSLFLGFTGVVAGATLLLTVGQQGWNYLQSGTVPPPYYVIFSAADQLFFYGTLLFGVLGGFALLLFGFLWMFGKRVNSAAGQLLSLFPILWAACRLARYVMSYSSTIRNAYSSAQAAMLILSLLFFYMFGQHLNGRLKLCGVGLPACAFAFGIMAVSAFAAQWFIRSYHSDLIAGVVVVTDVTDLLCGVFALAVGAVACSKKAAEKTEAYLQEKEAAELAAILGEDGAATVPLTEAAEQSAESELEKEEPEQGGEAE